MFNYNWNISLFSNKEFENELAIRQEVNSLKNILQNIANRNSFCVAHELANRFGITQKHHRIARAANERELKPFHFLINKN